MADQHHIKINLRGGIASVGMMSALLNAAKKVGIVGFRIGTRQQLLTTVSLNNSQYLQKALKAANIDFDVDTETYPNIISSYPAASVFHASEWLTEGGYQDILSEFAYRPKLKINISDNKQSFTPFFTGHLNFVASQHSHYWYLYVRLPKSNQMFCWDKLIYSTEIPHISQLIEDFILKDRGTEGVKSLDKDAIQKEITDKTRLLTRPISEELVIPRFMLPYYEGFNRYGDRTWLGIYRRNEFFKLSFLESMTQLCQETKIGQICLTPWRSIIIKGIEESDRLKWERILGKFDINLRHAAIELNWQHTDGAIEDVVLKNEIVEEFNRRDARTFGVCFAIKSQPKSEVFGSIIIKKRSKLRGLINGYRVLYKENFNPNSRKSFVFKEFAFKMELPTVLLNLYEKYQAYLNESLAINTGVEEIEEGEIIQTVTAPPPQYKGEIYSCPNCLTVYDAEFGDELSDISSGTAFDSLPSSYCCPTCETEKVDFIKMKKKALVH
jgi:rubredoxin